MAWKRKVGSRMGYNKHNGEQDFYYYHWGWWARMFVASLSASPTSSVWSRPSPITLEDFNIHTRKSVTELLRLLLPLSPLYSNNLKSRICCSGRCSPPFDFVVRRIRMLNGCCPPAGLFSPCLFAVRSSCVKMLWAEGQVYFYSCVCVFSYISVLACVPLTKDPL